MDAIVKMISEKVGITEKQAQQAVTMVLDYLKDALPAPLADQIDGLVNGAGNGPDLGGIVQGLGGLLGQK